MISIFSNYLAPLTGEIEQKPSNIYTQLRIAYNQGVTGMLNNVRIISVGNDDDDYNIICESFANPEFKKWINWVNKKITLVLGIEEYQTIDIRIRIAVNMLNKLVYSDVLPAKLARKIHRNLVDNVKWEMSAINTEDLPF